MNMPLLEKDNVGSAQTCFSHLPASFEMTNRHLAKAVCENNWIIMAKKKRRETFDKLSYQKFF